MKHSLRFEFFKKRIPIYRKNPVLFAEEVLNFHPDEWQSKSLMDLAKTPKVAIKSGQGVGKTGIEAVALLWFLCCFPYPRVVATAPTKQQLHDVLWSEVSKWLSKSPLLSVLLKWTKTYIYMTGYEKRWFAVARTATKPENMQGFHEDNMLFIVDEASGVADPIMEAILGTLSGANNKLLMCANPTKCSGVFFDAFNKDRELYCCYTVSSADSTRTNKDNIKSLIRKYGENSNVVRVRVYGEFPNDEDDVFFSTSEIYKSLNTEISKDTEVALGLNGYTKTPDKIYSVDVGCDVARFGDDKTVITYKINELCMIYKKINGKDTTWTAGNLVNLYRYIKTVLKYEGPVPIKIDNGGIGGGVIDQLMAIKKISSFYDDMLIYPINFGQPKKHLFYYDTTTIMLGMIKDLITPYDSEGNELPSRLILPKDDDLIGEFTTRKYDFVTGGKQKVESKKEMKSRGLPSPDIADSIALCCWPVKIRKKK
ncbi:MAG: DEAD/DEAH box helicase family protein [Clostridia bacterium]|nr:DEAD/DEAH box helicase family protein [Clostridia bacterium]